MAKKLNLEKTLAEVEVLLSSPGVLIGADPTSPLQFDYINYINGIYTAATSLLEKYSLAKKSLFSNGKDNLANRHITEFAIDAKNLAENLKLLLQIRYSSEDPDLRRPLSIERDIFPKTKENRYLDEVFCEAHDFSKTSVIKILRDIKGHYRGQVVVQASDKNRFRYNLVLPGKHSLEEIDAEEWLDKKAFSYMGLTKTVLETISGPEFKLPTIELYKKRFERWAHKHKTSITITLATAGVVGGIFGTLLAQEISSRNRQAYEADQIQRILSEAQRERWANEDIFTGAYWISQTNSTSNTFNRIRDEMLARSSNVGFMVDNYIARLPAEKNELIGETKKFVQERAKYRFQLRYLKYDGFDSTSALVSLEELRKLLKQEGELEKQESRIVSFFPRMR